MELICGATVMCERNSHQPLRATHTHTPHTHHTHTHTRAHTTHHTHTPPTHTHTHTTHTQTQTHTHTHATHTHTTTHPTHTHTHTHHTHTHHHTHNTTQHNTHTSHTHTPHTTHRPTHTTHTHHTHTHTHTSAISTRFLAATYDIISCYNVLRVRRQHHETVSAETHWGIVGMCECTALPIRPRVWWLCWRAALDPSADRQPTVVEYNACHILEAVNVNCSKLMKRRLQQDKVQISELLQHSAKRKVRETTRAMQACHRGLGDRPTN